MAVLVLLVDGRREFAIGPEVAAKLTALGVTSVALARDTETVALVLDGWAFEPDRSARAAIDAIGAPARPLEPVFQLSVP